MDSILIADLSADDLTARVHLSYRHEICFSNSTPDFEFRIVPDQLVGIEFGLTTTAEADDQDKGLMMPFR